MDPADVILVYILRTRDVFAKVFVKISPPSAPFELYHRVEATGNEKVDKCVAGFTRHFEFEPSKKPTSSCTKQKIAELDYSSVMAAKPAKLLLFPRTELASFKMSAAVIQTSTYNTNVFSKTTPDKRSSLRFAILSRTHLLPEE